MTESYHVLARKYRPQTFSDLMGQDVLVTTLKNAIEKKRIPHAILLTGVRGIGKTTTARIIARSLNCIGEDGQGQETIHPCGKCQPCVDILNERHLDVIEMDAASRTSVDDIRSVIEAAYYKPASARYKIQIIDEVHMLTKQAFNALLKTLEEPPEYTKFIFATTELGRVPDTIISRCVRFDLKRFDRQTLFELLKRTCERETIGFEDDALGLLAQAANGSARDAQSLLERAISLSDDTIQTIIMRDMLGLTGQTDNLDILLSIVEGQTEKALALFQRLYENGADPDHVLSALCDLVHVVTVNKVSKTALNTAEYAEDDREKIQNLSNLLSVPLLTRLWQVLTKGREELKGAPSTKQAVDMILIRLCYLSDQPTAHAVLRQLGGDFSVPAATQSLPSTSPENKVVQDTEAQKKSPECEVIESKIGKTTGNTTDNKNERPSDNTLYSQSENEITETKLTTQPEDNKQVSLNAFEDVIALCEDSKEPLLKYELENHVHLLTFDGKKFTINLRETSEAKPGLAKWLQTFLKDHTGQTWGIQTKKMSAADVLDDDESQKPLTIRQQKQKAKDDMILAATKTNLVKSALEMFPGAKIKDVTPIEEKPD